MRREILDHAQDKRAQPFMRTMIVYGNVLGDLWGWVVGVFERIGDVSVYWLALALALKTAESALIGLAWRNILRAAYPSSNVPFKIAWGASQGGTAINAIAPAQAGTVAMIGMFRASIPSSSVAGLTSATVVESIFFAAVSALTIVVVAIFLPRTVSKGSPSNEVGGFFAAHPVLIGVVVLAVVAAGYFLWPHVRRRVVDEWEKARQGAAIFRDRRRYVREVAFPSGLSYCCRMGVTAVFMAAFGLPVTFYTVFLVASSHTLSQLFAITPGGVGQTQALDLLTLRRYASSDSIGAFSITQDSVITICNVVLGVSVMLWAFGYAQTRQLLSRKGRQEAQKQGSA